MESLAVSQAITNSLAQCSSTAVRYAAEEIDHELVWLLVSLGTFFGLTLWFATRLPMPKCVFTPQLPDCPASPAARHAQPSNFSTATSALPCFSIPSPSSPFAASQSSISTP